LDYLAQTVKPTTTRSARQNYYAGRTGRQRRQIDGDLVEQLVLRERRLQPRLGTRKLLWHLQGELKGAGVKIGRDRLFEHLRERDLLVLRKPARQPRTTQVYRPLLLFKNLIKDLVVNKPNEVWVSDVTYIATEEGYLYLSLITDTYSRKMVGHHVEETLATVGPLGALEMALKELPADCSPIHHSDRGCQYDSRWYVERLQGRGFKISMTEVDRR
jgi:putative transposase